MHTESLRITAAVLSMLIYIDFFWVKFLQNGLYLAPWQQVLELSANLCASFSLSLLNPVSPEDNLLALMKLKKPSKTSGKRYDTSIAKALISSLVDLQLTSGRGHSVDSLSL